MSSALAAMYERDEYLSSVKYIQQKLADEFSLKLKPWKLMHILHHHLGMKYKKVKAVSWKANDPKNLILRQQFARSFLELDLNKKVVINVDETWLGMSDFRRMKWTFPGQLGSVAKK